VGNSCAAPQPTRRRASDGPVTVWGRRFAERARRADPLSSPGRPSPKPPTCPAVGDRGMVMRLHGRRSRSDDHPGQYARWMRSTAPGRGDRARRRGRRPTRPAEAATDPGQGSDLREHRRCPVCVLLSAGHAQLTCSLRRSGRSCANHLVSSRPASAGGLAITGHLTCVDAGH